VFGAVLGVGGATVFRNTAGAVGSLLFYNAIVDQLIGNLWRRRFSLWTLQTNAARLVGFPVEGPMRSDFTNGPPVTTGIGRPLVLFAIYAVLALAIAYAVFRQRDVT
jgi:hypothetical protein